MSSIIETVSPLDRYQSFVVFEPASVRISDHDILVIGSDVRTLFDATFEKITQVNDDVKLKILMNQFQKISNMLDLLETYDNVIITKYFDRIWRRYAYVSHLGEMFLNLKIFLDFFPHYDGQMQDVIAQRVDTSGEEFVDEGGTTDDADQDTEETDGAS